MIIIICYGEEDSEEEGKGKRIRGKRVRGQAVGPFFTGM
jgi:hypothetical protein